MTAVRYDEAVRSDPDDAATATARPPVVDAGRSAGMVALRAILCGLVYAGVLTGAVTVAVSVGSVVPGWIGVVLLLAVGFGTVAAAPEIAGWLSHAALDWIDSR